MNEAAPIALVAGSGLALESLLTEVEERRSFADIPGMTGARVPGHDGCFIRGRCGNISVIVQGGRLHLYEGHPVGRAVRSVDCLAEWGVRVAVFTNAAGGLLPDMPAGALLAVDRVSLWPCVHWPNAPQVIEPDLVIDGCDRRGAYHWVHGPAYETRAEIRVLQSLGAAAVGMSTAPELWRCRQLGIKTAVVSCITNNCCTKTHLTHDDVVATAARASARLARTLADALPALCAFR
jgi:purine-nucleoside phosphorylase